MPRAKVAESKKRTASTKSVSDEELSPKRAKAQKDSNKTGILDKCVFCTKSGVRTMLEGAGTATNMRFFLMFLIYGSKIKLLSYSKGFTWRLSTTSLKASSRMSPLPRLTTWSLGSCCPTT